MLAIATLTLGIALTGTMFTLVERIMIRPLSYPHPERLVILNGVDSLHKTIQAVSPDDWNNWSSVRSIAVTGLVSFARRAAISVADTVARVTVVDASAGFFAALNAPLRAGRVFTAEDERSGALVAVVGEALWRRIMGANEHLPLKVTVDGISRDVIGVVRAGAEYPAGTDLWLAQRPPIWGGGMARNYLNYQAVARLRPGTTLAAATTELDRVSREVRTRDPAGLYDYGVMLLPLRDAVNGDLPRYLRLLMGAVLCVLLIACANFALITIGRGTARQREMATRAALGATRARLFQQLLIEHVLIGILAGVAAFGLSLIALRAVALNFRDQIPRAGEIHLDAVVAAFFVAIPLIVGILAGLVPAVRGSRASLQAGMKRGGPGASARNASGSALVAVEVALAIVLLIGAGLLVHSFARLMGHTLGFDRNIAAVEFNLSDVGDSVQRAAVWDRLMDAYRSVPGVQDVAVANWIPLGEAGIGFVDVEGRAANTVGALYRVTSEAYLRTMGIKLLVGRGFVPGEGSNSPRVALVSDAMVRKYWPGGSPLGQRIRAASMEPGRRGWITIVGVVSDIRQYGLERNVTPEMYVPYRQAPADWTRDMTIVVRSTLPAGPLLRALRRQAHTAAPGLAGDFSTLDSQLRTILAPRRIIMSLLTMFAGLALILGALGVYGILSYAAVQRRRELAIRFALGAQRKALIAVVVWPASVAVAAGLVAGLIASLALTRLIRGMLVDVSTLDPLVYLVAIAGVIVTACVAIVLPADHAMRLDPVVALRAE